MTFRITPPRKLSGDKIKAIALGRDTSFPRPATMAILRGSEVDDKEQVFHDILMNKDELSRFRYLAAQNLYLLNSNEARKRLLEAVKKVKDPEVQVGLVKNLGRVGGKEALEEIVRIQEKADGVLRHHADFAASLLCHRFGLSGHDLKLPEKTLALPAAEATPVEFYPPGEKEAKLCRQSIEEEPFDIDYSMDSMRQLDCRGVRWMLVLNKEYARRGGPDTIKKRKTLFGVMAGKNTEDGRYSITYLMLTAPSRDGEADIILPRATGEHGFIGKTKRQRGDNLGFTIKSSDQIGIFPMETKGYFNTEGQFELESVVSAVQVKKKRNPERLW